ncbi:GNAT family N-acetyltransferase [Proteiniclasticum sp.]|uniref:GNAT family N-acetyltransferase n=1 Tax=Proteiniclasticum sp. TaxID=2053595 RepID=UPI00289645C1|nr:GNAT family N-acetyltransferase [Proteiniclasticum sp.]
MSIWNDLEMGKYMPDPSIENMDEDYRRVYETLEEDEMCCYLISESSDTGKRIGTCSFVPSKDGLTYDLGYCVHMEFWTRGYGTEMVQGLIGYAKSKGAKIAKASVNKKNGASNAIMRNFGFKIVGEAEFEKMGTDTVMETYLYSLEL